MIKNSGGSLPFQCPDITDSTVQYSTVKYPASFNIFATSVLRDHYKKMGAYGIFIHLYYVYYILRKESCAIY